MSAMPHRNFKEVLEHCECNQSPQQVPAILISSPEALVVIQNSESSGRSMSQSIQAEEKQ